MKKFLFSLTATTFLFTPIFTSFANAQTRLLTPNERAAQAQHAPQQQAFPNPSAPHAPQQQAPTAHVPVLPISEQQVEQTRNHINGEFTRMNRVVTGGQIQEAWDDAETTSGFYQYKYCPECVYHLIAREHMVSSIQLPKGEIIDKVDVGDPAAFQVEIRNENQITVKPHGFGMDSSMIIYGAEGRTYPIYLRAEGVNSSNIPDIFMKIGGTLPNSEPTLRTNFIEKIKEELRQELEAKLALEQARASAVQTARDLIEQQSRTEEAREAALKEDLIKEAQKSLENGADQTGDLPDFIKTIEFDPAKLHGFHEYDLWGENWKDYQKPAAVYRDDRFTYIHFGENYKNVLHPVAFIVVDEKDQVVNTRVQGTTLVVESINPLIRLVAGESYLCVNYTGEI